MNTKKSNKQNVIKQIENSVELPKLVCVDLSGQGLTTIANSILERNEIGKLNLSSNNFRTLSSDIRKLVNITHLDLSRNTIKCVHAHDYGGLPAELAKLGKFSYTCFIIESVLSLLLKNI